VRRALLASALTAVAAIGAPSARADTVRLVVGGGASERGAAARAELATRFGRAAASVRADDTGARLSAVAGIAPAVRRVRRAAARWDARCLDRLGADDGVRDRARDRCWTGAHGRGERTADTADGWFGAVAGVRRDDHGRASALAAIRIHPTDDVLGDYIELGVSGVIAGRDRLFVQHMRFAPGWYARVQTQLWRVVVGGELGMTGLAARTSEGTFRAEVFASATVGLAVGL
jgi:hypothetical protein